MKYGQGLEGSDETGTGLFAHVKPGLWCKFWVIRDER